MRELKLILVSVLLLWAVSMVTAEVKPVKLCGREIIRAMVYTCGGSRWRRTSNTDVFPLLEQSSTEDQGEVVRSDVSSRDLNHMMTMLCCQVGCKKSDLSLLC